MEFSDFFSATNCGLSLIAHVAVVDSATMGAVSSIAPWTTSVSSFTISFELVAFFDPSNQKLCHPLEAVVAAAAVAAAVNSVVVFVI